MFVTENIKSEIFSHLHTPKMQIADAIRIPIQDKVSKFMKKYSFKSVNDYLLPKKRKLKN